MSNSSKGNKLELIVKKKFEQLGWKVFRQHRRPMFIKGKMIMVGSDIFGADLVCLAENSKTLWVQVCTIENKNDRIKKAMVWPWDWNHNDFQVWCYTPRRSWRVFHAPGWSE
jgi:hypothetical protein